MSNMARFALENICIETLEVKRFEFRAQDFPGEIILFQVSFPINFKVEKVVIS